MAESKRQPILFACQLNPEDDPRYLIMLARSLRTFGGGLSQSPLWVVTPAPVTLPDAVLHALDDLQVTVQPCPMPVDAYSFPFLDMAFAAASAERLAAGSFARMVWMCLDTLFLQEPSDLLLPAGIDCAVRPVHHRLVGSPAGEPLDAFWQQVYADQRVDEHQVFMVNTCTTGESIRAYFNAGLLVVRPEHGLLGAWFSTFQRLYCHEAYHDFCQQDKRYTIFLHQALLSGAILHRYSQAQIRVLPGTYNYPLHLHQQTIPALRPARLDDLVTARYEELDIFKQLPLAASPGWLSWLHVQVK